MSVRFPCLPLFAALIAATGCDRAGPPAVVAASSNTVLASDTNAPFLELEPISDDRADIELLKEKFNELKTKVDELGKDLRQWQEISLTHENEATLDFSKKVFTTVKTRVGYLFVSSIDAQPYLDGYKLIVHIGNPTTARFDGITVKVQWGLPFDLDGKVDAIPADAKSRQQ